MIPTDDTFVFLGDSLTDDGTYFDWASTATNGQSDAFAAAFGYAQRFSNGPVYAEYLADRLGVASQNYAVAGAEAEGTRTFETQLLNAFPVLNPAAPELAFDINLGGQLHRAAAAPDDATFLLFFGSNDYQRFEPTTPETALAEGIALATAVLDAIGTAATQLLNDGATSVALLNLPDPDFFPAFSDLAPDVQALGEVVYAAHNAGLQDIATLLGPSAEIVDINGLTNAIAADPQTFGFLADLEAVAVAPPTPGIDLQGGTADQIAFWDSFHFSTALHGVVARFVELSFTAETVLFLDDTGTRSFGTAADEAIFAGASRDVVIAGDGTDTVFGGRGDDKLRLQQGDDVGAGGAGDDKIVGQFGNDVIAGNGGDDELRSGRDADLVLDGLGDDLVRMGSGDDVMLHFDEPLIGGVDGEDTDIVFGGGGFDTLVVVRDEAGETEVVANTKFGVLDAFEITYRNVEQVIFTSRAEVDEVLADLFSAGPAPAWEDADIWGFA